MFSAIVSANSLILSSVIFILLFSPYMEFFLVVIVFLSHKISIWVFLSSFALVRFVPLLVRGCVRSFAEATLRWLLRTLSRGSSIASSWWHRGSPGSREAGPGFGRRSPGGAGLPGLRLQGQLVLGSFRCLWSSPWCQPGVGRLSRGLGGRCGTLRLAGLCILRGLCASGGACGQWGGACGQRGGACGQRGGACWQRGGACAWGGASTRAALCLGGAWSRWATCGIWSFGCLLLSSGSPVSVIRS